MNNQLFYLLIIYAIALFLTLTMDTRIPFLPNIIPPSIDKKLDEEIIPELLTGWQLTHLFTRILCGFIAPQYYLLMFSVDLTWEFSEFFLWKNHNWLDLVWNSIGIIIGICFRSLYDSHFIPTSTPKTPPPNHQSIPLTQDTEIITSKSPLHDLNSLQNSLQKRKSIQSFKSNPSTPDL